MPLRTDSSLWFNHPACIAAYQPVRGPDPLQVRYNQAHGGDNRYKAVDVVVGTVWTGSVGWQFNISAYLNTGITFSGMPGYTAIARYVLGASQVFSAVFGVRNAATMRFGLFGQYNSTDVNYGYGSTSAVINPKASGVFAVTNYGYRNGVAETTALTWADISASLGMYIGARNNNGSADYPFEGTIQAIAFFGRVLSSHELWTHSRQMQYCDVNPDWSAWGRRRKWCLVTAEVPPPNLSVSIGGSGGDVVIV